MFILGIDEVGRGAWAGPLFASVVVVEASKIDFLKEIGVQDSKKLSPSKRLDLYQKIVSRADFYAIELITSDEIDRRGVGEANILIFQKLIEKVPQVFFNTNYQVLIDGNHRNFSLVYSTTLDSGQIKRIVLKHTCIKKGDALNPCISAASILAKVERDEYMIKLASQIPFYGFEKNKGYGTRDHKSSLNKFGICSEHRKSFSPIKFLIQSKNFVV